MLQIASKALNVSKNIIKIKNYDTTLVRDLGTAAANRQTYNSGNAVLDACIKLKMNIEKCLKLDNKLITSKKYLINVYNTMIKNNLSIKTEGYFKASTSEIDSETGQ